MTTIHTIAKLNRVDRIDVTKDIQTTRLDMGHGGMHIGQPVRSWAVWTIRRFREPLALGVDRLRTIFGEKRDPLIFPALFLFQNEGVPKVRFLLLDSCVT